MLVLMGKCNNLGGVNVLLGCSKVSVTLIMLLFFFFIIVTSFHMNLFCRYVTTPTASLLQKI